jgi:hypothetical protein
MISEENIITRDKEQHNTMINGPNYPEDSTFLSVSYLIKEFHTS